MAVDIEIEKYNPVAQLLLEAFDESEISEREGSGNQTFSYVPPERYRYRLLKIFSNGYTFHLTNTTETKLGVKGTAHFIGEVPEEGVRYDIIVDVFEPWTFKRESKDILNPEQSFMKLASAGVKAIAREIGLGLHLYDKAAKKSGGSKSSASSSGSKSSGNASPSHDGEWTGDEEVTFGTKWKGKKWKEVDDDYLTYVTKDPEKANKLALKEIARRQKNAASDGQSKAEQSVDEDENFPF